MNIAAKFGMNISIILSIFIISACSNQRYFERHTARILKKYPRWKMQSKDGKIPDISRQELKKQLAFMEKNFALSPDSMKLSTDSESVYIYTNENKIRYIQKHHLKTSNMRFD